MSGPSKVIVLDPDPRAGRQVQLGFAREGVEAVLAAVPDDPSTLELTNRESSLVLIGGTDGAAVELVRRMRKLLTDHDVDIPIVFSGAGKRAELEQAGADEVVLRPVYLRDVVTIGRLMSGVPATQRNHIVGSLVETTGVLTLVRAFSALGRSAVLTLIRGLRRGEVRFYKGEVTSAQVGLIHGQAALHQLLLWTDARFDFHHEANIVRRQQIPMTPEELFVDAERFLEGVRESAGRLSPAMVLEQDVARIHNLGSQVPTEVHGVLRMFDGHRVLADVLEDSPYRVFETLRVAQKALEAGLLKPIDGHKPKATWRTLLTIEEWLVGSETRDAIVERTSQLGSGPTGSKKKKKHRKNKRTATPAPGAPPISKKEIDWGALVPRIVGAEVGPLSGVVPALRASGEITVPTREGKREGLEALMDTDKRTKIFPTEIGVEPSVVWNEEADRERAAAEQASRVLLETERALAAAAKAKQAAEAAASAETKVREDAARVAAKAEVERSIKVREEVQMKRERDEAAARVKESVERMRIERELKELAAKQSALEAERDAKINAAKREAEASMAQVKAALERRTREETEAHAREIADAEATKPFVRQAEDFITEPTPKVELPSNATMLVKALLVAEGMAADSVRTTVADALTIAETPTATVSVADTVTVVAKADTAVVTATPTVTISGVPVPTEDDPSDGVVRGMIATADTAKLAARSRRPSSSPPESDGPPEKEKTGEIRGRPMRTTTEPATSEPSILVTDLAEAHSAVAAAMSNQAAVPATPDVSSPARELSVAETRKDALAASDAEEAFFSKTDTSHAHVRPASDSFDDLDEGYEPPKFWDRVFGRRKRPSTHPPIKGMPRKK